MSESDIQSGGEPEQMPEGRRARVLLATGALAGLVLAMAGILEGTRSGRELPPAAAALVNGSVVSRANYERAVSALDRETRDPLDDEDRRHILDRMIEEELLVQRAVSLGLDRSDPVVRNTLVSAMIESVVAGVGQREPSAEEVATFYEENREFFARTDRFWVRQLRFPVSPDTEGSAETAAVVAREAAHRLRNGENIRVIGRELGQASILPLQDGYLPLGKLREYLGPTPARRAAKMQTGDVSEPIRGGSAYYVLQMVERITSPPLPLGAVETQVRAEMRRRAGDESLRAYLDQLRADADVWVPAH